MSTTENQATDRVATATDGPLGVIVGVQSKRGGLYFNFLGRVSTTNQGIVDAMHYRGTPHRHDYAGATLEPPARAIIDALCTDEFFLGVKRIDYGQTCISVDVMPAQRHQFTDFLTRILELIAEHYGRELKLFVDLSNWLEHEVPLLMSRIHAIDPEAATAEDFEHLESALFRFRHPEAATT